MRNPRHGKRGSPKVPQCPACQAGGARPVRTLRWFQVDGQVKELTVRRVTGDVRRKLAWVECRRLVPAPFGAARCGWGWWSAHPALVALAERHPNHVHTRPKRGPYSDRRQAAGR